MSCCRPRAEQSRADPLAIPDNPARVNLPPSRAAPKPAAGKKRWHMPPARAHTLPRLTPPPKNPGVGGHSYIGGMREMGEMRCVWMRMW